MIKLIENKLLYNEREAKDKMKLCSFYLLVYMLINDKVFFFFVNDDKFD
jgi:hypothetical protein